ncbi:glucokinase [Xylella fastidiosa]|uniref:Glucokinase n=1 Tax=Xylella fastidiosa TaxID=2371 RepID=A0ABC8ACV5_XYLFS|nr:glucokinase family protein [Xylella fastidiosa]ALR06175.1 glucokinase [Xylella fastidiosa]
MIPNPTRDAPNIPSFVAADVGGTHVRVSVVAAAPTCASPPQLLDVRTYRCADYPSLSTILNDFLGTRSAVRDCVIASAGFQRSDGTVITTNLPWPLSPHRLRADLDLAEVSLVNDFEALAYATEDMEAAQLLHLTGPAKAQDGPRLLLGPGTGLGAALWIPNNGRPIVLPTEAGQAALPSTTELEMQLVRHMQNNRTHVPIEHALSGPGILNVYRALCALQSVLPQHASPDAISHAATAGTDMLSSQTLEVFCDFLGSIVGDLVMMYGAQGGVYLAGGILPQLREPLLRSHFVERFLNKGPMGEALQHVPVRLIEHGQLGIVGAARWYLNKKAT